MVKIRSVIADIFLFVLLLLFVFLVVVLKLMTLSLCGGWVDGVVCKIIVMSTPSKVMLG